MKETSAGTNGFIRVFENFISEEECNFFLRWHYDKTNGNKIPEKNGEYLSPIRASDDANKIPEVKALYKRISEIFERPYENFENFFQIFLSMPGTETRPHVDTFKPNSPDTKYQLELNGDRYDTFILYLNDEYVGGELYFPKVNGIVVPKAGMLVYWRNIGDDGKIERRSTHHAPFVAAGEKYISVFHTRQKKTKFVDHKIHEFCQRISPQSFPASLYESCTQTLLTEKEKQVYETISFLEILENEKWKIEIQESNKKDFEQLDFRIAQKNRCSILEIMYEKNLLRYQCQNHKFSGFISPLSWKQEAEIIYEQILVTQVLQKIGEEFKKKMEAIHG